MSDSTFEKILVKNDTIGCITSKVKFAVNKSGQNITSQPFKAISETTSAHVYNVTVPSLETIISREVLWKSTVTLKITTTGKNASEFAVNYGVTDALSSFPLQSLVTTMTCTINNNTVSMNMQDTLPILLRMLDPDELAKYDGMTPTTLDFLADYTDGVDRLDWVIDAAGADATRRPVVAFPANAEAAAADNQFFATRPYSYKSANNNSLAYDSIRPAGSYYTHKPRGSWKLKQIWVGGLPQMQQHYQ
jgi:hypothetical protein